MNSEILNLKVFVDDENFQEGTHIFYEKRFQIGKVKLTEYYYNHKLETYFTTKTTPNLTIIKGYTQLHKLFHIEIIIFKNNEPYYKKEWIANRNEEDHRYEGYIKNFF